jgi:hypothetical protein
MNMINGEMAGDAWGSKDTGVPRGFSVEVVCTVNQDTCESLKRDFSEMLQRLCNRGLCLKKVILFVKKPSDQTMLQLHAFDFATIDAFGVFLVDREKPFELVSALSAILSSYLYSSGILQGCPRWVIEGFSLYYALKAYAEVDAESALTVEKRFMEESKKSGVDVDALGSWRYKEHPVLKALSKSNILQEKAYRVLQVFYTTDSERDDGSVASFRAVAYMVVRKALESLGSSVGAGEALKLLASFGDGCSAKVLELSGSSV